MRQRKEIREESGVKNEGNRSGLEKQQIMAVSPSEEQNYELGVGNSLLPSPASLPPVRSFALYSSLLLSVDSAFVSFLRFASLPISFPCPFPLAWLAPPLLI